MRPSRFVFFIRHLAIFKTLGLIAVLFSNSFLANAEYRAYELRVDNTQTGASRTVSSTLDHLQYPRYYPLRRDETISYVDSWRCWENMGQFRKACPKPESVAPTPLAAGSPAPN